MYPALTISSYARQESDRHSPSPRGDYSVRRKKFLKRISWRLEMEFSQYSIFPACTKLWVKHPALHKLGMAVHNCNPSTWEIDTRGSGVQGHSQLHSEFKALPMWGLSQKHKRKTNHPGVKMCKVMRENARCMREWPYSNSPVAAARTLSFLRKQLATD